MLLKNLKKLSNNKVDENILKSLINLNDELLTKNKKCKVCNKKYDDNNRYYGDSCVKNLYKNASIANLKDIEDKESYLHSAVMLKLGKTDITKQQMDYVCESYFSKLYFERFNYVDLNILKSKFENRINENKKPIMKLNTAYRINNILKRNKKILNDLSSEELDKKIDEKIVKFLKTYFSLKKMSNPIYYEICYYMQLIIWEIIISFGKSKQLYFSADCLSHSLSVIGEKPKNVTYTNKDKYLIDEIKEDVNFKEKIQKIIKKYQKTEKLDFDGNDENNINDSIYSFESGDLFYSLHSVTISLKGTKIQNKWNLNVELTDQYDFTEILSNDKYTKKNKKYLTLGNILNDMGTVSTCYGVLKSYDITIKFNWNDFNE